MEIFFQYRIFPLYFVSFCFALLLRSYDAQIATKITSGYNIWETKWTQEKYSRRGRPTKTGNVERRVKRCENKGGLGGQRGRRPGGRPRVICRHKFLRSLQRIAGDVVPWTHTRTTAFHLCVTQKSCPPSNPNNSSTIY